VAGLAAEEWPQERGVALRRFAVETLERHLERRLVSARAL
jgi:DNA repair protein RecO (recombination protein O)